MKASVRHRKNVRLRTDSIDRTPEQRRTYKLPELLSRITKKNLHRRMPNGGPLGKEIW
jgi:antitoxin component of MazEF toxin-antitoxin module